VNPEIKSVLDDVFKAPEENVETFYDALKGAIQEGVQRSDVERITSGKPEAVKDSHSYVLQTSGFIQIDHGWHNEDYALHIRPITTRKPWRVTTNRVIYAIAKVVASTIPNHVEVKIWPPQPAWEINEITFKAIDLKSEWSVSTHDLEKMVAKMFEVLNTLV
jgi:hypothetical protein